jgi:hypothetical protein
MAGCTSSTKTATPTHTTTVTEQASPAPSTSPSSSSPPSSSAPAAPATAAPVTACATSHLAGSLGQGSGAAGTGYIPIILTNRGSTSCTIQGWPGVSAVGHGNGTQIGPAAILERNTPHPTLTLAPGGTATATVKSVASNAPDCDFKASDGYRVYPPGQRASLFISTPGSRACSGTQDLEVSAFR